MRFSVFWLALIFLVGTGFLTDAAAQVVGEASISECEQARQDWAAIDPPTRADNANDRLAYLKLSGDTRDLRADLDCDHRLSFDEYLTMQWNTWRRMDTDQDGAVSQAEYVTEWCTRRLGELNDEHPDWRPTCERASASNFQGYLGARRPGGIDLRAYRHTVQVWFRREDENRDGYLTRSRDSASGYE